MRWPDDDVRSLGIIGTGPQAVAHVHAMRVVRPDIERSSLPAAPPSTSTVSSTSSSAGGESAIAGSYADAAACDIVCSATRADSALFGLADVRPGTHVNLVGSYRLDLREVAADLVAASTVAVDDLAAAKAEAGDLHLAVRGGRVVRGTRSPAT